MRATAGIALVAVAACALGGAAHAHVGTSDPQRMVLRLRDLPTGFEQKRAHYESNAAAAKASADKNFSKLGRLNGYEADYVRAGGLVGIVEVDSTSSVYKTASGAHGSMAITEHSADTKNTTFHRLSVGTPLGDEERLYKTTASSGGLKIDVYIVVWRSGRVYSSVTAGAMAGSADPADVVKLARKQEQHINGS